MDTGILASFSIINLPSDLQDMVLLTTSIITIMMSLGMNITWPVDTGVYS